VPKTAEFDLLFSSGSIAAKIRLTPNALVSSGTLLEFTVVMGSF